LLLLLLLASPPGIAQIVVAARIGVDVVVVGVVVVVVVAVELIETIIPIFIIRATTFCLPIVAHTSSPARVGVRSGG